MGRIQISEKCAKSIVPIGSVSASKTLGDWKWHAIFLQQGSLNIPYVLNWILTRVKISETSLILF